MNVSLNWLSDHLDLSDHDVDALDRLLTFAGVEVEGIEQRGIRDPQVVVARVESAVQHPDADRLKVCMVDAGEGSLRQIVCGAQNYKVGDKVPCALPGAVLPGDFKIKDGKLRGVESRGMLCSASELGLTDGADGLMILPADAPVGTPLHELFSADTLLEVEVTPNRPDLLSHTGMARELAALTGKPRTQRTIPAAATAAAGEFIRLEAPAACPFYTAVRIDGVTVGESPTWLKERLTSIGLRPINNIVDITNFVLHELGQPLHAFDLAKLNDGICVRHAHDGEAFAALDGLSHCLNSEDLVIADHAGNPLALAGVMGGAASGVSASTTAVLLESAWFATSGIRRTSRRLGISSDSSYRYERGVDPGMVLPASAFAAKLIVELAGGTIAGPTRVAGAAPVVTHPVALDPARFHQLMGASLPLAEAEGILTRLGLTKREDGLWEIPSFRADLQRHIDLVEEIARVHGLAKVPARQHGWFSEASEVDASYDHEMALRHRLVAQGFYEAQTIKLISDAQLPDALALKPLLAGDVIRVNLPLSEDHAVMRPSLVPGLVAVAARNVRQGASALRFFELGRHYRNAGGGKATDLEGEALAILLGGPAAPASWSNPKPRAADIYDLKALIAALLPGRTIQLVPRERAGFAMGADVLADGQPVGTCAALSPARCRELDFTTQVWVAELDVARLRKAAAPLAAVSELPQFPGSTRDVALEMDAGLPNSEIEKAFAKIKEPLLATVTCFDVFSDPTGARLAAERKSIAYTLGYRSAERTLTSQEVDAAHARVCAALKDAVAVSFR
jgi:phenylalanyl-tRNA synthetase beta chain